MTNAKEELLEIITKYHLTILFIDCYTWLSDEADITINGPYSDELLDKLDFEYNNGFGLQELYGKIYCVDKDKNPVWLTRSEYDGSEWWKVNTIPDYYFKNEL